MAQLTDRCDIWRMVGTFEQGKQMRAVFTRVPCLKVPISGFDQVAAALVARDSGNTESFRPEGRTSTDLFLLPSWVLVQASDELRRGRRTDITNAVGQFRYTVDGARDYGGLGYQDVIAVFCRITQ